MRRGFIQARLFHASGNDIVDPARRQATVFSNLIPAVDGPEQWPELQSRLLEPGFDQIDGSRWPFKLALHITFADNLYGSIAEIDLVDVNGHHLSTARPAAK